MPSVQIKNVPEDVHAVLRRRAAAAGQSLQSYLLARLVDEAETGSNRELFERIEKRRDGSVSLAHAAESVRADRDAR
ncbi:MAG: hypothetical protein M3417_08250 [Actinomycetota bacterium]|nr:hypothetical protein [Actinomycetota bacterium]